MARKKKPRGIQQITTIILVLIAVQLAYLFLIPHEAPRNPRQIIEAALKDQSALEPKRRELLKVQIALTDYKSNHEGNCPPDLAKLVPTYFDSVPKNPDNNEVFKFTVKNGTCSVSYDLGSGGKNDKSESSSLVIPASFDGPLSAPVKQALLRSYEESQDTKTVFIYDPTGKRDPFQPFDFAPKVVEDPNKTALEKYDINQLKLTAVIGDGGNFSLATVENAEGRGFSIKKGTKIGTHSGEVVEILKDKILILETTVDFAGQKKSKTLELRLRTKDQEAKLGR